MITYQYTVKVPWGTLELITLFITHQYTPLHADYTAIKCNNSVINSKFVKDPWGTLERITHLLLLITHCYTPLHII